MKIREQFKQTEKLYHFTSFDTALKIIETNRLKFGRLNNMNDIQEKFQSLYMEMAFLTTLYVLKMERKKSGTQMMGTML